MSLSDVIRNITKTVTDKDELKEKAKDLPMFVVQTTLSAAGQVLLLADRVKNVFKGKGKEEQEEEEHVSAADQLAASAEEAKPARREPVIFAPRPTEDAKPAAEAKPAAAQAEPAAEAKPADTEPADAKPVAAKPADAEPVAAEPVAAEPVAAEVVGAEPVEEVKPAVVGHETVAIVPDTSAQTTNGVAKDPVRSAKAGKAAQAVQAEPVEEPAATKVADAKPATAEPAAVEPPVAEAAAVELAEPLPGYAGLTVASLRARLRGKSAAQIQELLDYERATSGRPEVIRMFENRLAKLEAAE